MFYSHPPNANLRFHSDISRSMLIKESALEHWIDNFYGYGSWHAPIWFVGYEEGGGEVPEEVAERINYFSEAHASRDNGTLCDIRALYRHRSFMWQGSSSRGYANHYDYRFGDNAVQNSVWKNLITFEHAYRREKLPDTLEYQKNIFASPTVGREASVLLYPLPSPHNHGWYYSWLDIPKLSFLKSRTAYEEHLYQHRMSRILSKVREYKPLIVLMYGMNNINALKATVQEVFQEAKFTLIKSIKMQIPQHHRADLNGTTLLITTQIPALRHNRVETGFDWEAMGKQVNSYGL
jgi:hypothetical protein